VLSLLFAFLNLVTVLYQEGCTPRRIGFVLVFAENKKIFEKREYKRKSGLPHEQTAKRKDVVLKRQDVKPSPEDVTFKGADVILNG